MPDDTANELGDFLRAHRERLNPQAHGLPSTLRRRTPGLRREEVAALAGIGIDWYIRLEQGRCVSPSATTIDSLGRALKLNAAEKAHLRALTHNSQRVAFERETVPEGLRSIVEDLAQPAYLVGRRWDVLAWNRAANRLFGWGRLIEEDRNILIHLLTNPDARRMFGAGWADQARRVVAQFRVSHDLFAGDPAFIALRRRLREGCPEFSTWWKGHDIRDTALGVKILKDPKRGVLRFTHASFQSNDNPGLRLVIYSELR